MTDQPTETAAESCAKMRETSPWTDALCRSLKQKNWEQSFHEMIKRACKLESAYHEAIEALEFAKHNLDVCCSDSHYIRTDTLRKDRPALADVIDNIRKWSIARQGTIRAALSTYATLQREMDGREG